MSVNFEITDFFGSPIEYEAFPTAIRISQVWNGPRILEATLPMTTQAAPLLSLGRQLVIVSREEASGRVVRFHGILWARTRSFRKPNPTITITAVDPWPVLAKRVTSANYTSEEQLLIARDLVDVENAISSVRISTSIVPASSKERDRSWADNPRPLDEALQSLTTVIDPIDIDLRPIDLDEDGNIVEMVLAERDPAPSSTFTLGWGEKTVDNCEFIEDVMSMEDVVTQVEGFGDTGLVTVVDDPTALATFGLLVKQETWDSVREQQTLDDHAALLLQKYRSPIPTVTLQPSRNVMLWDDFEVGDVIDIDARLDDEQLYTQARVNEATVEIDGNGERIIAVRLQEARV